MYCGHIVDFATVLKGRRKVFNLLVFLMSLFSLVNISQSLPHGLQDFNESNRLISMEQDFKKLDKQGKSHHLSRRIAAAFVPLRERQGSALCSYEVTSDVNPRRIPQKIDKVKCLKASCKCAEQGDFRCTQLYTQLNVSYLSEDLKTNLSFELIDVEYGCVCSKNLEGTDVNILEPVLV